MNTVKNVLAGIGILIVIYLILSKGDMFVKLVDTVSTGFSNGIQTLYGTRG